MYGGKLVYPWQLASSEKGTKKSLTDLTDEEVVSEPPLQEPVINRVALHASALEFKHPATGEMMKFEAPLPEDMQNLLDMLRKYRKI